LHLGESLATVLLREVRRRHIQTIVVLRGDQELSLLLAEFFVGVVARLSEDGDVVLELLDLIKVVDKRFADLLDKQRPVCDLVLDLLFLAIISLRILAHLLGGEGLRELTSAL